jgi:hypothetical protein
MGYSFFRAKDIGPAQNDCTTKKAVITERSAAESKNLHLFFLLSCHNPIVPDR